MSPILFTFFDPILPRFINVCIFILMLLDIFILIYGFLFKKITEGIR